MFLSYRIACAKYQPLVLADEAIGILIRSALPSMVRRRKINLRIQDVFQFPVVSRRELYRLPPRVL
jgi:hypothetical protein